MVKDAFEKNSGLLLFTTDEVPGDYEVLELYQMVQVTGTVKLSKEGLVQGIIHRKRNQYQEVLENFKATAPPQANSIIAIKHSTTVSQFQNGSYLFITYIGTPALIAKKESKEQAQQ